MKNIFLKSLMLTATVLMLTGCIGSILEPKVDPTRFYVMSAIQPKQKVDFKQKCELNMLNIIVPAYMERNQIVVLNGATVEISEFNRWAETPMDGMQRVLHEDIAAASDNISVYVYPGIGFSDGALNLRVFVNDCIGTFGGNVKFTGRWQLSSAHDKTHISKSFNISVPCGETYASYVAAVNTAISDLSAQIVAELNNFSKKENK